MNPEQLNMFHGPIGPCLFEGYISAEDHHCNGFGLDPPGYDTITEDDPRIDSALAEIGWIDVRAVPALDVPLPALPAYIPVVTKYSKKLFTHHTPAMVAVKLADVVSRERLEVIDSIENKFGIPAGVPVLLQCYGKDRLLENIWPDQHRVFSELSKLGFAAVTGLNYSVWRSQSHAERLINIMRAHVTYNKLQLLGVPAIPHVYWCDEVGISIWAEWFNGNEYATTVAIDLQTMRRGYDWDWFVSGLESFVKQLKKQLHFVITGPTTPARIRQIRSMVPTVTFINGTAARLANAKHKVVITDDKVGKAFSIKGKSQLFQESNMAYVRIINERAPGFAERMLRQGNDGIDPEDFLAHGMAAS